MKKLAPLLVMTLLAIGLLSFSFFEPFYLSDKNKFLKDFVNHEFLAILGFIVALTLNFSGNIYFELNRLEDKTGQPFIRARSAIRKSSVSLLVAFGVAGILVITKPMLLEKLIYSAIANTLAILIVFFNLAVLYDLSNTVFGIPTVKKINEGINSDKL